MQIQSINNISFGRKPNAGEMKVYTSSINRGLKLLNKQVDIIIHNSAAPAEKSQNTGIGSLFSTTVQKKLIPFLKSHGITGIQQEPNGLRKIGDPSPYAPEASSKNIFMIPLEKLATQKYNNILPKTMFEELRSKVHNYDEVDYKLVTEEYDKALRIAYSNFKNGKKFRTEFNTFKKEHSQELEKNAIFRILDNKYKKTWTEWDDVDKYLYSPRNEKEKLITDLRKYILKSRYKREIDYYAFQQFLIDLENKESNKLAKQSGIKIIGDSPVAQPAADEWINQNLYLEDKAIGCPPDYFSKDGQRWGFRYFKPEKIFNPDGTLGEAGKILKKKYDSYFASFPGGLRIDHIIGLVDPFIYSVKDAKMTPQNSGRIYSGGKYKKSAEEYSNIMEKIVLQSAKEHGLDKSSMICEDLGEVTQPTRDVMEKFDLSGVSVTQFDYRGKDVPQRNVIMIGSHDNQSFLEYTENFFNKIKGKILPDDRTWFDRIIGLFKKEETNSDMEHFLRKTQMLGEDTAPVNSSKKEVKKYIKELRKDKKSFMAASFAELFTSPARRVQIFFADFWGIGKTYNRPGTSTGNWSLRIGPDFEKDYYEAVREGKAPNLAQAIATALRQRGLTKGNEELLENLDNSAKILKE